jgi:flagellar protein FlbD
MITLTRLNGSAVVLNAELIKAVESTPDTMITLIEGDKIRVKDSVEEVVAKVIEYRRQVFQHLVFFRPEADT